MHRLGTGQQPPATIVEVMREHIINIRISVIQILKWATAFEEKIRWDKKDMQHYVAIKKLLFFLIAFPLLTTIVITATVNTKKAKERWYLITAPLRLFSSGNYYKNSMNAV